HRRIQTNRIANADVHEGSITKIALPDCSVDKVICLSVLQYVGDSDVRLAFSEFARVLKDGGLLVLHVKNLASLYLSTLWLGQRAKLLIGKSWQTDCDFGTMPGITGIITKQPYRGVEEDLGAMIDVMQHEKFYRSGQYLNKNLGAYVGWVCHEHSFADCMPLVSRQKDLVL